MFDAQYRVQSSIAHTHNMHAHRQMHVSTITRAQLHENIPTGKTCLKLFITLMALKGTHAHKHTNKHIDIHIKMHKIIHKFINTHNTHNA